MFRKMLLSLISSPALLVAAVPVQSFRPPLVFEPNRGQAPAGVKWIGKGPDCQILLTAEGLTLRVPEGARGSYATLRMRLDGGRPWNRVDGSGPTGGFTNYLHGSDAASWRTRIQQYSRVTVPGVYDGVDLVLYAHGSALEYDIVIQPGADAGRVRLAFDGIARARVDSRSGDLILTTPGGSEVRHARPQVYQESGGRRVDIGANYRLLGNRRVAFRVARYDRSRPLVIDPNVSFTHFLAASGNDFATSIAVDSDGNSYVTGVTDSTDFPVDAVRMQGDQPSVDAFVTKLSPKGDILFSTYLGGSGIDYGFGITFDATGVYVTGLTSSPDFPHQNSRFTAQVAFVTKLHSEGDGIFYTALLPGRINSAGHAIAVDPVTHLAYITGQVDLGTFPIEGDILLAKLDASGGVLRSIHVGGGGTDDGSAIALDPNGDVWVGGTTCSQNFPISFPAPPPAPNTCTGFVGKWDPEFNAPIWARFWGIAAGIAVDTDGNGYVGGTATPPFAATKGAFQEFMPSVSKSAGYATKFSPSGDILSSTFLGGSFGDSGAAAIAINADGDVYLGGDTTCSQFPGAPFLKPNPTAGFVSRLSPDLTALHYSRLLGAEVATVALVQALPLAAPLQVYVAGYRFSQTIDAFVVKLNDDLDRDEILWHIPATGETPAWMLNPKGQVIMYHSLSSPCGTSPGCPSDWNPVGTGDFNQDGVADVVWHNQNTGEVHARLLNLQGGLLGTEVFSWRCGAADGCSKNWKPIGIGDFNRDSDRDLLWHNEVTGEVQAWLLNTTGAVIGTLTLSWRCGPADGCPQNWKPVGVGDFNADGIDDVMWHNESTGEVAAWILDGHGGVTRSLSLSWRCGPAEGCPANWRPFGVGDLNQDGNTDVYWHNVTTGEIAAWLLDGQGGVTGARFVSQKCDAASGCSQSRQAVGVRRSHLTRFD